MDAEQRYCIGCGRTLDEIARWGEMSDEERSRVMAELPSRKDIASRQSGAPTAPP